MTASSKSAVVPSTAGVRQNIVQKSLELQQFLSSLMKDDTCKTSPLYNEIQEMECWLEKKIEHFQEEAGEARSQKVTTVTFGNDNGQSEADESFSITTLSYRDSTMHGSMFLNTNNLRMTIRSITDVTPLDHLYAFWSKKRMPGNKIKIESAVSLNIPMKFRKVNDKKIYDVLFIEDGPGWQEYELFYESNRMRNCKALYIKPNPNGKEYYLILDELMEVVAKMDPREKFVWHFGSQEDEVKFKQLSFTYSRDVK